MPESNTDAQNDTLRAALERHAISLADDQIEALNRYCRRLWDWNERINLTRHTTYDKFVGRDVVDSRELAQLLAEGERVLDVGTGGGVPGAIVHILRPDLKLWLCDSVGKKALATAAVMQEAGLSTPVKHARAEELLEKQRFDTLVVRAVAPLAKLLRWFQPHWQRFGRLLVIKGPQWPVERSEARAHNLFTGLQLRKVAAYPMPGGESESVVLEIRPRQPR